MVLLGGRSCLATSCATSVRVPVKLFEKVVWPVLAEVPGVDGHYWMACVLVERLFFGSSLVVVGVSDASVVFDEDSEVGQIEVRLERYFFSVVPEADGLFVDERDSIILKGVGYASLSFGTETWLLNFIDFVFQ